MKNHINYFLYWWQAEIVVWIEGVKVNYIITSFASFCTFSLVARTFKVPSEACRVSHCTALLAWGGGVHGGRDPQGKRDASGTL